MKLNNLVTLMITFKEILDVVICLIMDHLSSPLFNRIFSILNVTLGPKVSILSGYWAKLEVAAACDMSK